MGVLRDLVLALYNVLASVPRIFRAPRMGPSRLRLAAEYARLRTMSVWHRRRAGGGPTRVRFLGRSLRVRRYETFVYLVEEIFVHQTYRFDVVRPDPLILDVGSNVGLSVLYFKLLYPRARILAFEPDPESCRLLRANVEAAGLDDVEVENAAAWDAEGTLTLGGGDPEAGGVEAVVGDPAGKSAADPAGGGGRSRGSAPGPGNGGVQVRGVRLSTYVAAQEREVDLVKMDVEGAEVRCLRELSEGSAFDSIREVIVECHHNAFSEPILTRVLEIFEREGFRYRIRAVDDGSDAEPVAFQDVLVHARRGAAAGRGRGEAGPGSAGGGREDPT